MSQETLSASGTAAARLRAGEAAVAATLAALAARRGRALLVLAAFALLVFLPGLFAVPVVDRDEARFVQTSRQMLESGDLVDLRLHEETRYKKPIGIYWLHAAAATLTTTGADAPVWVFRLISLAGGLAAVLLTFRLGARLVGPEAALVGALLLAASVIVGVEARLAKTDAALLACVVAAQLALSRLYLRGDRAPQAPPERFAGWPLLFWAALGIGVLIKGPIAPMVSGLTVVALALVERRAGWLMRLRPLPGLAVLCAIVVPWLVAIQIVSDGRFLAEALGRDMLGKVTEGQESHGAPPGVHTLLFWVIFWPGAALVAASLPAIWRGRGAAPTRFLLAWIVPSFLVFEIAATKLPHYTMPTYPAIALLAGAAVVAGTASAERAWARLFMAASGVGGALIALAAVGGLVYLEGGWPFAAFALAIAVLLVAGVAVRAAAHGLFLLCTFVLLLEAFLVYATVFGAVAPRLDTVWVAPRLAAAAREAAPCETPQVLSAGYNEASLMFEVGTTIRFGDGVTAADFLRRDGCRVAVVSDAHFDAFVARARALGYRPAIASTVSGINIGNSKWLTFQIATRAE